VDLGDGRVQESGERVGAAAEQPSTADGVPASQMGEPDGELGQPLPEVALGVGRGLPRGLEYLVGVEGQPGVEQLLRPL
jgi:hypothetical protein